MQNHQKISLTNETFDVMIDIETLGTRPDSVVLSVGAVAFTETKTEIIINNRPLKIDPQISAGRSITGSTLLWWMQQDERARDAAFRASDRAEPHPNFLYDSIRLDSALKTADWLGPMRYVWANSPSFDLTILRDLFDDIGCFWKYWQERDVRTISSGLQVHTKHNGVPHTPVWDCLTQIEKVRAAWEIGRGVGPDADYSS